MKGRVVAVASSTQGVALSAARAGVVTERDVVKGAASLFAAADLEAADDMARLALLLLSEASEPMTGALIDQAQLVFGALE